MAPSPELGQPKAPDKVHKTNKVNPTDADSPSGAGATTGHVTAVQREKKSMNATTSAAITNTQPADAENLGNWDDTELKKLLDEAITYKRPKDREHKSETFKELLQHAELEDQARADCYIHCVSSRVNRGSSRHTHSGSLQDLVEAVHNEHLLEPDFSIGSQTRRNHHNSRQKKYSSVSSRGREGGSLPSNVNCNLCPHEDPFLNEFSKRNCKSDKAKGNAAAAAAAVVAANAARQDSHCVWVGYDTQPSENKISHTVIEIESEETRHLLAHDSLAQGHSELMGPEDGGTELNPMKKLPRVAVNYTTHQLMTLDVSVGEPMSSARSSAQHQHIVDKTVDFTAMLKKPPIIDSNPVQLKNSYPAVNSCIDQSSMVATAIAAASASTAISVTSTPILPVVPIADATKSIDENGNSVLTFPGGKLKPKAKQNKFDRNTRTLKAEEIIGNRGGDDIKKLLAFIENTETTRKNGMIATNGNEKNKKDKSGKKDGNTPKGEGQLKKSNSLEELKSSSKLEEEKESEQVRRILRQKHQMTKKNSALEIKDNQKNPHRRGERRSWGTEELTYLGDTSVIVPKKDESAATTGVTKKQNSIKHPVIQRQKSEEHSLSIVSIESVSTSSETAEFHVVTKKKKAKKRQMFEETRQKQLTDNIETTIGHRSKYHPSQNYANERGDMYLSSFSANDRRKSTSSVPPSDKSDSSDLDSVHSLPIESTIRLTNSAIESSSPSSTVNNNGANTTQVSYADIARFSNPDKGLVTNTSNDKWPTVSSVKLAESVVAAIVPIETAVIAIPPKSSHRTQRTSAGSAHEPIQTDFHASPNPITDNTMPITYSQSLTDDKQITLTNHDEHKRLVVAAATASTQTAVASVGNSVSSGKSQRLVDIIKSSNTGDNLTKSPLQKSKSCDNDNYVNMSIDQYPALEKTVKPQKQYQSVPFVEHGAKTINLSNRSATSNIPLLTSPPNTANIPHPIVKKAKSSNVISTAKQQQQPKLTATSINKKVLTKSDDNQYSDRTVAATSVTKKLTKKSKMNATSMAANNHNRPAVIIMNDNCEYSDKISPLLFGDLTDELRRLLEQDSDEQDTIIIEGDAMYANGMPDESIQKDTSSSSSPPSFAQSKSVQSDEAKGFVTSSPQSDLGYASLSISNHLDRSTLSNESINNISNVVETAASADIAPPMCNDKICGPSKASSSNANLVSSLFKNNSKNSSKSVSNSDDSHLGNSQNCAKSAVNRNAGGGVFVDPSIVFAVAASNADVSDTVANSSQISETNKTSEKQSMLRYVAPPKLDTAVNYNHEKIVNFVGMAWEDVMCAGARFYHCN